MKKNIHDLNNLLKQYQSLSNHDSNKQKLGEKINQQVKQLDQQSKQLLNKELQS